LNLREENPYRKVLYVKQTTYVMIVMTYIAIDQEKNILVTENEKEVEKFLSKNEGIFYVISVYPARITIEKYQTVGNRTYKLDTIYA